MSSNLSAEQTLDVTLLECSATISPTNQTVDAAATAARVAVSTPAACEWTATSEASFVTLTSGSSGTGSGTVSYEVAGNTTGATRSGTINIAGQTFTVTQPPSCGATLSPTNASLGTGAATGSLAVAIPAGCTWTATSNASHITVTSGTSGVGPGTVGYSVAANATGSTRTGTVTIAQQTFTVTQSGVSCSATLSPAAATVAAAGGSASVAVTIPAGCSWTATSGASWATITGGASGVDQEQWPTVSRQIRPGVAAVAR